MLTAEQRKEKRRLIHRVIFFCLLLIPVLGYAQFRLLSGQILLLPKIDLAIIFGLINLNALILLLTLYLVLRNLAELFFERRHQLFGFKLRSKLVVSFIALSFLPTTLLFLFAFGSISTSMDYWFNSKVEESLQSSSDLVQSLFLDTRKQAEFVSAQLAFMLESKLIDPLDTSNLEKVFGRLVDGNVSGAPDSIFILNAQHQEVIALRSPRLLPVILPPVASGALRQAAATKKVEVLTLHSSAGELVQAIAPVHLESMRSQTWFAVATLLIPSTRLTEMRAIMAGLNDYQHLIIIKAPMKLSLNILLIVVTMLIVFGSIWLGLYISRTLTTPINELALATRRVAEGDLDFQLERPVDDEMGVLVASFNAMTTDLKKSNQELSQAHAALTSSNEVSEQRRNYLETILEYVPAGVIALDEGGNITTINRFAEQILSIDPNLFVGHNFRQALPRHHALIVESFLAELMHSGKSVVERHLRMTIRRGEVLSLQVNVARMADEKAQPMGFVIVFDNLTNLEQAQRLAAWQEVARRIAHEIKNPLTPIQLSAQRLRKRCMPVLASDQDVFDQCTETIIKQVDEIRKMVEEFSEFARMPKLKKTPSDLAALVKEVVSLYQQAHQQFIFNSRIDDDLPVFSFDAIQVKRVLINLLDNAIAALDNTGEIAISLEHDKSKASVLLQVADNGVGIAEEVKLRIFEPYYSTRKSGTGLGLAICQTIVSEHGGSIRVADNEPAGTVFTVELPLV
jgi:two-component system nitrogen regulation sensor histidine kinase NtrY